MGLGEFKMKFLPTMDEAKSNLVDMGAMTAGAALGLGLVKILDDQGWLRPIEGNDMANDAIEIGGLMAAGLLGGTLLHNYAEEQKQPLLQKGAALLGVAVFGVGLAKGLIRLGVPVTDFVPVPALSGLGYPAPMGHSDTYTFSGMGDLGYTDIQDLAPSDPNLPRIERVAPEPAEIANNNLGTVTANMVPQQISGLGTTSAGMYNPPPMAGVSGMGAMSVEQAGSLF